MDEHIWRTIFGDQNTFEQRKQEKQEKNMTKDQKRYKWNCIVFEIATNWENIRKLQGKQKNGELSEVYKIDQQWLGFLQRNNIDLLSYNKDDKEKFIDDYFFERLKEE